jgi:cytidylate kinase
MAIVTISRGTFSGGQLLAACVAERLGYRCISREVFVEAAKQYGVPLEKLSKALTEPPGFLHHLTAERIHYLAYIRAALCKEVKDDRVVYHGLAGHLLLKGFPNVLRVRVIADMEFRIKAAMERQNLSREKAVEFVQKIDEKRVKWTKFLYHVDWSDPSLYDIVINIERTSIDGACDIVCQSASLDKFNVTPHVQRVIDDILLSTEVRAILAEGKGIADGGIEIEADGGIITIGGTVGSMGEADKIREIIRDIPGVKGIHSSLRVRLPVWSMK